MIFRELPLAGAYLVELEPRCDERGLFARIYCDAEVRARGLRPCGDQWSLSATERRGTVRGLHYQAPPRLETKLVRCVRGAVYDVILDLRAGSPTFGAHVAVELDDKERRALYVPPGLAHGFQSLTDHAELLYAIAPAYVAGADRGVRHDDPALGIAWPLPVTALSPRDAALPRLAEIAPLVVVP